jgi:hypothetical protein
VRNIWNKRQIVLMSVVPRSCRRHHPQVAERIRRQPECRLLWAVLQDGVGTYMKYFAATGRRGKRLFAEAERWIMEDDPTWLCSFVSICHILGLEPDYLRTGLKRWRMRTSAPALPQAA